MSVIPQSFGLTRTDRLTVAHECCFSGHRPALLQRKHSHANTSQSVQTSALATRVPGLRGLGRSSQQAQKDVLDSIKSVEGRGKKGMSDDNLAQFEEAVAILTKSGGVRAPTRSGLLDGKWRLLFTTRPGSASPIQRAFVGVNAFTVYQEITLQDGVDARVNNIVDFGPKIGQLKVEAEASTDARPREGFTPRKGAGLPLFGKSENYPAEKQDMRIDFQFDQAAFDIKFLPFKIPYPVPFKLLGDETKGWLDTTYLSEDGSFRISKGNKGTVFVLVREQSPKEALLAAVAAKAPSEEIKGLIEKLQEAGGGIDRPAQSSSYTGSWELLWDFSPKEAPAVQRAVLGVSKAYQLASLEGGGGKVYNVAQFPLGLSINTIAQCNPDAPDRSEIAFDEFYIKAGPLRYTLPFKPEGVGYWTWLYLDDTMRVMEGSKGSMFIHQRIPDDQVKP